MTREALSIKDKILLAGLRCTHGDIGQAFTGEQLLVAAWEMDNSAFGLRGYELRFPDSNRLYTNTDGKDGLVAKGYFVKAGERTFRLSPAGFAAATSLKPDSAEEQIKLERELAQQVNKIISHPVFQDWLKDSSKPSRFHGAGHFWGIAPGTPPRVVRDRLKQTEMTLKAALEYMGQRGTDQLFEERGKVLCDQQDIERALDFQRMLKSRFARELKVLDPESANNQG
jgi:hypothetical protein